MGGLHRRPQLTTKFGGASIMAQKITEIDIPARKVRVKITMFGRELPAELELHQVKLF